MTKKEFLEDLREQLKETYHTAKWYRGAYCTHLFELETAKRRAIWDAMSIVEKANDKDIAEKEIINISYKSNVFEHYASIGLVALAELFAIREKTLRHIGIDLINKITEF